MRLMFTDERWAVLAPLVATKRRIGGQPRVLPGQFFVEAMLDLGRTGIP